MSVNDHRHSKHQIIVSLNSKETPQIKQVQGSSVNARSYIHYVSVLTRSRKHYREYLVSLINSHSVDPAPLYSSSELLLACKRYKVEETRRDGEDSFTYYSRLLEVRFLGGMVVLCGRRVHKLHVQRLIRTRTFV